MSHRVPWDDLPGSWKRLNEENNKAVQASKNDEMKESETKERNYWKEFDQISRRVAFGAICGSITGATFGLVDVLRDTKVMTAKSSVATAKIVRFTLYFGGFFAAYQGTRKLLKYNITQSGEANLITAGLLTLTPMMFVPTLRPLIPYGMFLIAVDSFNGINDI